MHLLFATCAIGYTHHPVCAPCSRLSVSVVQAACHFYIAKAASQVTQAQLQCLHAGQWLFHKEMNQAEVVSMLLGYTPLPFEANPALFQSMSAPPNAQNMLRQMLQRNPAARPVLKVVSECRTSCSMPCWQVACPCGWLLLE